MFRLLMLCALLGAQSVHAEVFKCVVNGKTVYKSAAVMPEGCEAHEVKAAPYNPDEAARQMERNEAVDQRAEAYQKMLTQRRDEAARRMDLDIKARSLEEQTRAREAEERQADAQERAARRPIVVLPY